MNYFKPEVVDLEQITITNHLKDLGINNIRKEIIEGLFSTQKYISSKFFYDEKGSKLFEDITQLPEYYPTRTEKSILKRIAPNLMSNIKNIDIIELGSGDCSKINILFSSIEEKNLENINYIPVDVSQSAIHDSAQQLIEKYPELSISGLVADFTSQLELIPLNNERMFCFLGSTLGNFTEENATNFLINLSSIMEIGDTFLLGIDLVKPINTLHAAYNDSQGITANFNINILNVVNDIIESDFNTDDFEHKSFFNKEKSRIEMHLIAKKAISIQTPYSNSNIVISKGENIHTENSYKFSMEQIQSFGTITNLTVKNIYTDPNNWFALVLFQK